VGKPECKMPLGGLRRRWEENIQNGTSRSRMGVLIWLKMRQVASSCECVNESSGSIKCREFLN